MTLSMFKNSNSKELRALNGLAKATNSWNHNTDTEEFLANRLVIIIDTAVDCGMSKNIEDKTWALIAKEYPHLYKTFITRRV